MGRPRKPTSIQQAKGYFKKHPDRRRDGEPVVTEALCPPGEHLEPDEVEAYQEIAKYAPTGVLTRADSIHVELTARLMAQSRRDWANFPAAKIGIIHNCLGKMGMTPADRAKLDIPKPKGETPFDSLS
jgi:hypothetical protein